ncbi:HlyD family efflux transporter periplasmic adaptor subunit [Pseudomonas gingeri]|uniref:HlyD family efflux transporter periplasmic adaptor subunit n=1 Tax=Pseudomonas gingeri TaxID=117681 RepID=A0A7Y7WFD7_9PSED|nr:HlyD family efflux transporter periplasmic adaptor subunit [Pseudomonas gingeri]NWB47918.1 HlyD family efflux transporter periplasmic adaptor subunit [Pseudomonas gingeri]
MNASVMPDTPQPAAREPIDPWERFIHARTSDAFGEAWLALLCEKFPSVRLGAVLVEGVDGQTFVPLAVWPKAHADMARMGPAVQAALKDRRIVVQPVEDAPQYNHVAVPISVHERVGAVVVLETANDINPHALLREVHWSSAWLSNLLGKREHDTAVQSSERLMGILETLATTLRHRQFQQALFDLGNQLRQRFDCSRVAVGLVREAQVKLVALSETATFEKSSPLIQAYLQAMGESCDLALPVCLTAQPAESGSPRYQAHEALRQRVGADALLSVPITHQAQTVGVLVFERVGEATFDEAERRWLETFASLLAPVIVQRRDAERNSLQRLGDESAAMGKALVGPRHLVWKCLGILLLIITAVLLWMPVDYRVSAKTVAEGEIQQVAAAPFEGFLAATHVRAGDVVKQNQVLAELDDHDLLVERAKWASERDQYDNKLREALATHDLTAIQVIGAQLREAQAQLDLLNDKLSRTHILAPYPGVIVSGDLSQQVGTPVEAGKKLFEIAPLGSYRIILQVDERDIGQVSTGLVGELLMNGLSGSKIPFSVAKVMPVATALDGKNFYRVEARLPDHSALLLPGMEGVGKINIGSRKLGWVLFHNSFAWLRMTLWSWGL